MANPVQAYDELNGYGTLSVSNAAGTVELSRPGFAVFVGSGSGAIPTPVRLDIGAAQAMMKSLTSAPGQRSGAPAILGSALATTLGTKSLIAVPITPSRPAGIDPLEYTSLFAAGDSLARNRSQTKQVQQLQQALSARAAAAAARANAVVTANNSSQNGSQSGSAGTGGSGSPPIVTSPPPLSGSLTTHDINAATVTANTIYAHDIDAQHVIGTVHIVNGNGNGNGGSDLSTTTVQYGTITAHDIHATTVTATDIYVDQINY